MQETRIYDTVVTFHSTHQAILAEKKLRSIEVQFDMIPTPRQISAGCGLSLELQSQDAAAWCALFAREQIQWGDIYAREAGGYQVWDDVRKEALLNVSAEHNLPE